MALPAHLARLEAESIHILRETAAEFQKPVMLYSIGKDSGVMLHLALKAFFPAKPPFAFLHVNTGWKFREMIAFRDATMKRLGLTLIEHINAEGAARGVSPVASGSAVHTQVMKTEALRQALDAGGFDAAIGGARRDEEKSRAKERIFSHRTAAHGWDPRGQRPELWRLFNIVNRWVPAWRYTADLSKREDAEDFLAYPSGASAVHLNSRRTARRPATARNSSTLPSISMGYL